MLKTGVKKSELKNMDQELLDKIWEVREIVKEESFCNTLVRAGHSIESFNLDYGKALMFAWIREAKESK